MTDPQYQDIDLVSLYDTLNPLGVDSDYYIAACAPRSNSVLDLGCGTGLLTAALANRGHEVVGVDPAEQMLRLARQHKTTMPVEWVLADGLKLALDRKFDRVIATGHVFQVFQTTADRSAFLATAARHLAPSGKLIFETRNPALSPWLNWTPAQTRRHIDHPTHGPIDIWHEVTSVENGSVAFTTSYHLVSQHRTLLNSSRLAFPTFQQIKDDMQAAGLDILMVHGNWEGDSFTPLSKEIIVTAETISR